MNITGIPLEPKPLKILQEVMGTSGVTACRVSRTTATPEDQARAMYQNLIGTGEGQGLANQLKLYLQPGQEVIQLWNVHQAQPRDYVQRLMAEKIRQLGPGNVSKHCSTEFWVTDIDPASVEPHDRRAAFAAAFGAHPLVTKFLQPPKDPAYHFQTPRDQAVQS